MQAGPRHGPSGDEEAPQVVPRFPHRVRPYRDTKRNQSEGTGASFWYPRAINNKAKYGLLALETRKESAYEI
jgi:hypothetical protein